MCKECQLGKMNRSSFSSKPHSSNDILNLVQTDLYGPMKVESYYGDRYIILFIDDYSRMMTMMSLKIKSSTFQMFKWYKERVEKEINKKLKFLRSDRGGEIISNEFNMFYNDRGIKRQMSSLELPHIME